MATPPRAARDAADPPEPASHRQGLLRAALALFRRQGFHGVAMADVLQAAGAPKGSLYHHFPGGKDELACAAVAELCAMLLAQLEDPRHAGASTAATVRVVGKRVAQWMHHTGQGECAFLASMASGPATPERVKTAVALAYEQLHASLVRRLRRDGHSPAHAQRLGWLVLALLEGAGTLSAARNGLMLLDDAAEAAASLCAPPARRRSTPPPSTRPKSPPQKAAQP